MSRGLRVGIRASVSIWLLVPSIAQAHSGPPFPVVSNRPTGPYIVSVWTDPDATDDRTAAGQFWILVAPADAKRALPEATRAEVSASPSDRKGETERRRTDPVRGDLARQFAAVVLDHEGPFAVHVTIDGPLGRADLDTMVDATYDLRPAPAMLVVYLIPFLLVGFLWGKQLLQRRPGRATRTK